MLIQNFNRFYIILLILSNNVFFGQLKKSIVVNMKQEYSNEFSLDFSYLRTNLISLDWSQLLKRKVENNYKGIPLNDSINYYNYFDYYKQATFDCYKSKKYDKDKFFKYIKE